MKEPIKTTIYCIIEGNGKTLLTEDEGKPGWKLAGGELEKGETLFKAAVREVKEETGFEVNITGLVSVQEYVKENGQHRLRIYLTAELKGGKNQLMKGEVKRIKWFSKKELKNLSREDFFIEPYYLAIQEYLGQHIYPSTLWKEI